MEKSVSEPRTVRSNGRTVEDAIQAGLGVLNVARDRVQVELLNEVSPDPDRPVVVQLTVNEQVEETFSAPSAQTALQPAPSHALQTMEQPATSAAERVHVEPQEVPDAAKQVLETLLRGMGIRSEVVIHTDLEGQEGPAFVLDIVGSDLGILIGRRGETLRDLEYITRLIVASKTHSNVRFAVDVEGYRLRRERVLRELAKRMADRVKQNRQPITLEAMPPNERRIVHVTLKEHPTVKTQSIGEGDRRRVMILPK
ncbi:MAG: KH domain-containing protein [Anaerolineae bacterium]|nr:KH domain-containing protein [Anaerolineae bacterium]